MTRIYRLALGALLAAFAVILFGSLARLVPAGSGCGNQWPLCNGQWLPARSVPQMIEYFHRIAALLVIVLTISTAAVLCRTPGTPRRLRVLVSCSLSAILLQTVVGGGAAIWGGPAPVALLHLLIAMVFLATTMLTVTAAATERGAPAWLAEFGGAPSPRSDRAFALVASSAAAVSLLLILFGASTSATGVFACATWPLCAGMESESAVHLGYRAAALLATAAAAASAVAAWRGGASVATKRITVAAIALVVAQTLMNLLAPLLGDPVWLSAPHLWIASLFWMAMVAVAAAAWQPRSATSASPSAASGPIRLTSSRIGESGGHAIAAATPSGAMAIAAPAPSFTFDPESNALARVRQVVADYVALTKPGIMSLLLITTLCAMLMAARGLPPFWLVAVTLIGGVLASGGANVLNCYIDRDIDGQMTRTRNRAIVAGRVSPNAALFYGIALTVASVLLLGFTVNWLAAVLALAGNLYYVFVYTLWLKRSTPHNIVIGGAAGAVPPLVGWAAVTGNLTPLAWGLFAIIFAWTPPHFWALALLKQGEYGRVSIPMLPVVRGEAATRRQIVIYTIVLTLVCLALTPFGFEWIYFAAALLLNALFLVFALRLYLQPSKRLARQTFFYSLWYLAILFGAGVIDRMFLG